MEQSGEQDDEHHIGRHGGGLGAAAKAFRLADLQR
jgi:hypothetical protein